MTDKKKKIAAALAAVGLYLEQEAAAALEQESSLKKDVGGDFAPWQYSGRQEIMSMRRLIQMRMFTHM